MQISIIVAIGPDGAIGAGNNLLWHIREDLQYFKRTTLDHTVIMGRRTFESIGRALPRRRNIVLTSNPASLAAVEGIEVFDNTKDALKAASVGGDEVFVMGGASVYAQFLPYASKMYLTCVNAPLAEGIIPDAFFPKWNPADWEEIFRQDHAKGEIFPWPFSFRILKRENYLHLCDFK